MSSTFLQMATAVVGAMVVLIFAGGCKRVHPSDVGQDTPVAGLSLDYGITGVSSDSEIESQISASLAAKYKWAGQPPTNGYQIYHVNQGPARWIFVLAWNGPRGTDLGGLYCYEQIKDPPRKNVESWWILRSYVPIHSSLYPGSLSNKLRFRIQDGHVDVIYRGVVVFTSPSKA